MASKYYASVPVSARDKLHKNIDGANEGVPRDLGKIADSMDEWEGRVAEELGLTKADIASIYAKHRDELKLQSRAALQLWKEKCGPNATYHKLIEVFVTAGKTSYAEAVCTILKESQTSATVTPETVEQQQVAQRKSYGKMEMDVLKKNEAKIKRVFAHLLRQVLSMLKMQQIDMDEFRVFVAGLFPGILQHIPSSASVSDFFAYITDNKLWSYSHYRPVESIAEEYLSDGLEREQLIDNYERELAAFNATTNLVDYIALCEDQEADPDVPLDPNPIKYDREYYRKLSLKLNTRVTSKTLRYVDEIWRAVANIFLLPSLSALLDSVVAGSLIITWCIPHHFAMKIREKVFEAVAKEFFRTNNVTEVKLDEEVLYNDAKKRLLGACEEGDARKVMEILQEVTDFDFSQYKYTPLGAATRYGHTDVVQMLLQNGFDVDGRDEYYWTALIDASSEGRTDMVELLLSQGADVNATSIPGKTALMKAIETETTDVVKVLINHGANVNARDEDGMTALMMASEVGTTDAVKVLIKHCADVNARNVDGMTALMLACETGMTNNVKLLINHSADINIKDENGWTALVFASHKNHFQVVQLLLRYHPDVNARDNDGFTALMYASREGYVEVVKVLLEALANPNIAEKENNWTPLFFASDDGCVKIVRLLIKHGADVDFIDKSGVTASDIALTRGHREVSTLIHQCSSLKEQRKINEDTKRHARTAGDYFNTFFNFFLPERARKRVGVVKDVVEKPKPKLRPHVRARRHNIPYVPT